MKQIAGVLEDRDDETVPLVRSAEHTKFGTLSGSILEMMLIVTSPGTVLAAMGSVYAASGGWGALFFVIFVIIGNMVIYKVVLAASPLSADACQAP